ncbi:MAG: glycosyltransferase family 39 protein [Bacteroidota bacterium]
MNDRLKYSLLFAALGALFFIPFLGGVHLFDWDEINFAEISREMLLLGEYTRIYINFEPFWEKPPLFFWNQAAAMYFFGTNEFAARLPNALIGIATLVVLFNIGKTLYSTRFGIIWAGVYFGSILPFLYFKSGIIDPYFNFFIFLGIYFFILSYWKRDQFEQISLPKSSLSYLFWGGFFIGVGILTKGQVAYLIACLTFFVYWVYQRLRFYVNVPQFLFFTLAATLVTLGWYGLETWKNGTWFIVEFNKYQYRLFSTPDAGHKGFPGYHFVVLLVGCFPASIFAIRSFFKSKVEEAPFQKDFRIWMKFLFWAVLILFTIVRSKIVHYSSMCYFPLTFLAAFVIEKIITGEIAFNRWMRIGLFSIGGLFVFATIALPFVGMNIDVLKPLFNDPFAVANLDAEVNWTGFEVIPGVFLLVVLILSIRYLRRREYQRGFIGLFGGTAVFVMLTLIFYIGRIESYSQRAAIEFYESKIAEDCYIITHAYKSYAHLFYAKKRPVTNEESYSKDWLISGAADKPVYVVAKIHRTKEMEEFPNLKELYRKNGFVFYQRTDAPVTN